MKNDLTYQLIRTGLGDENVEVDTRYGVRCLDGGAWDRLTSWGMAGTLEAAMEICRAGPQWRRAVAQPDVLKFGCTNK